MTHSVEMRARTIRRTIIRRGPRHRRERHIGPIVNTCHENRWETTKLGCRHLGQHTPETLVNGKNTVHVRTRNGLSQNGYGRSVKVSIRQLSNSKSQKLSTVCQVPDGSLEGSSAPRILYTEHAQVCNIFENKGSASQSLNGRLVPARGAHCG